MLMQSNKQFIWYNKFYYYDKLSVDKRTKIPLFWLFIKYYKYYNVVDKKLLDEHKLKKADLPPLIFW